MAQVTFRFVALDDNFLSPDAIVTAHLQSGPPADAPGVDDFLATFETGGNLVLDVAREAPDGAKRPFLRTMVFKRPDDPHTAFKAFSVVHDKLVPYQAYVEPNTAGSDNADPPTYTYEVELQFYITPARFFLYEFTDNPGFMYGNASVQILKEIFRRRRVSSGDQASLYRQRVVDLRGLRGALMEKAHVETAGWALLDVPMDTPISRMSVDGPQIDDNADIEDLMEKADKVSAFRFDMQYGDTIFRLRIDEQGSVNFSKYPGDQTGLAILHFLEGFIADHSELAAATVR